MLDKLIIGGAVKRIYRDATIISIRRFKKGLINETYDVKVKNPNKNLVLRIYPRDLWKARKEQHLYNLINKKTDIPTPKIISVGKNYILLSKIEGEGLPLKNKALAEEAGSLLAKLHSIKFSYYGWIIGDEIKPKFKKWIDFVEYDLNSKLKNIPAQLKSLKKEIKDIFDENKGLLGIGVQPCLLHKDYHSSHILVNNDKIAGIIDLEWAIAGHNELDIAKSCLWMFEDKPELEKIFLRGYKKYGLISKEFNERKKLYRLLTLLSSLSFSYECGHKKWCIYNLKKLKGELNEYH